LSRTYFEFGKALLEPKRKYKEWNKSTKISQARTMFKEMDLQYDQSFVSELNLSGGLALLLFNSRMLVTLGFNGTPVDVSLGFSIGLPF